MLQHVTTGINFIGLIAAIWMGVYLVMDKSRRPEVWLAALAVWSGGGYFLNYVLALLHPPAPPADINIWLYHLMLFWPRDVFEMGWKGWLLGWLPAYSIAFGYHTTLYVLPGKFSRKRLLGTISGYAIVFASILVQTHYQEAWTAQFRNPLYTPPMTFPFFVPSATGFVLLASLSVFNLWRTAHASPTSFPQPVFRLFVYAIALAGAAGTFGIISNLLSISMPQAFTALLVLAALVLGGTGWQAVFSPSPVRTAILKPSTLTANPSSQGAPIRLRSLYNLAKSQDRGEVTLKRAPLRDDATIHVGEPYSVGIESFAVAGSIEAREVELALRNLNNYAFLATSPLARLCLVTQHLKSLETAPDTSISRGKAVSAVLADTVLLLKPAQEDVPNPPQRSWYPFIILWDAYVENKPNLEIMSRLYISEGTFNRTRKAAIGTIAKLLGELEANL